MRVNHGTNKWLGSLSSPFLCSSSDRIMLLTITDNVIRSQTGFSFFLFLTIIFNKCHSHRNLSPSTRTSSRFISMHMEIFRQLAIHRRFIFIFKKKKRIDTIFINFHLSIVVLLSRCNKYIYTTKRSDSRSWPFFDEIRNFKRYSSNILFYQISSRLIEVKVEVEEFNSKRTRKENESVRLETWALVATSSRQFSVNSV